jgi:hypothetical protein
MGLHVRRDIGGDNQISASMVASVIISSQPFAIQVQAISHQWQSKNPELFDNRCQGILEKLSPGQSRRRTSSRRKPPPLKGGKPSTKVTGIRGEPRS